MKRFAQLLELLALTPSRTRKLTALTQYFREVPDPDRGFALAVLTGALTFRNVKPALLKDIVLREVDPTLFAMSYDYVGDLGETIALIWPHHGAEGDLPSLAALIELFNTTSKAELPKLEGGTCHPYRRKWKSERANHPVKAVAVAGGWTDIATMLRCYDQPDDADVLAVTSDPRKRRDAVAAT